MAAAGTRVSAKARSLAFAAVLAAATSSSAAAQALDPRAFVGRWTDTGDCSVVTLLAADGWFTAPNRARGHWRVVGDRLTIWGANGSMSWRVRFADPDRIVLTAADGSVSQSTRCRS